MRPVHQCALRFASCLDSETHVVNMLLHVVRHVCRGAAMFSDPPQVPKCPVPLRFASFVHSETHARPQCFLLHVGTCVSMRSAMFSDLQMPRVSFDGQAVWIQRHMQMIVCCM